MYSLIPGRCNSLLPKTMKQRLAREAIWEFGKRLRANIVKAALLCHTPTEIVVVLCACHIANSNLAPPAEGAYQVRSWLRPSDLPWEAIFS